MYPFSASTQGTSLLQEQNINDFPKSILLYLNPYATAVIGPVADKE